MSEDLTLLAEWDGEATISLTGRQAQLMREKLPLPERLSISVETVRNMSAHRAYFAEIRDLFSNIPERFEVMPFAKSPEAFRKHALIARGYCDTRTLDCGTRAAAQRTMEFLATVGDYAIIQLAGPCVQYSTAKSQSVRAMPNGEFKRSKRDVLEWMRGIVGVGGNRAA